MKYLFIFSLILSSLQTIAQDTLTLKSCFEKVEKSRYTLILEKANVEASAVNLNFHKFTVLPDLSASTNFGPGFGRILEPVSNQFSTSQVNSQSISLNSSVTLFNGLNYFKRKDELLLRKNQSTVNLDQSLNSLYTDVVSFYVDLCLKQAQIQLCEKRITHFEQLLDVQRELFKAGKITQVDTLRAQNLVVKERVEKIQLYEDLRRTEWQLNVLMGVDLKEEHIYDLTQISDLNRRTEQDELYLLQKNTIELELLNVEAKLARSELMPRVSLSGSIGTGYSTALKDASDPFFSPVAYREQLGLNLYQNIGFQIVIPIFNNGSNLKNRQLRRVKEDQLAAESELLKVNLQRKKEEVELAYSSALRRVEQLTMSTQNSEKIYAATMESYKNGKITFSELQEVFVEWQSDILMLESVNFELLRITLMRMK